MTDIHAALGLSQLERLDEFVKTRNSIYNQYSDMLSSAPLSLLHIPENVLSSVHLVVIQLQPNYRHLHSALFHYLLANNVGVQLHYHPVHLHPYYQDLGFRPGDFPAAEMYSSQSFSIPVYPDLSSTQMNHIANLIVKFFDAN
jgi:dTDP-4-amino-4,6-dideoxygalactose transaminase